MLPEQKPPRKKTEKNRPMNFRVDDTTVYRIKVLAAYYRKGLTSVVEDLIDQEFEKLKKTDPKELRNSEKFVK